MIVWSTKMSGIDWIIIFILAVAVGLAARHLWKTRKNPCGSCSYAGTCSHVGTCSSADSCSHKGSCGK